MANCPNCGRHLRLIDWRPECPGCGTNLNYFNSNKALLEESEKAEIEHAHFQPRIDRAKAAYVGSKFAIVRIILTLLPIGALFLPVFKTADGALNVLKLYNQINEIGIGNVIGGALSNSFYLSVTLLLLSAVMIIVSLVLILMSLGKHGKVRVIITYGLMLLLSISSFVVFLASGNGSLGIGAALYMALMLLLFIWNLFLLKKGIPVNYKQCLIGGLPSETYFEYINQGMSREELYRKMLVALAELDEQLDKELEENGGAEK